MATPEGFTLGEGLRVVGRVRGTDAVCVKGTVEGEISLEAPLAIDPTGVVVADVSATSLTVAGRLEGNVQVSGRVTLQAGCRVVGNLRVGTLAIEDGAAFRGQIEMDFNAD